MAEDKNWKTVKSGTEMGDSDEACWTSLSPIRNCAKKVVGGTLNYIFGDGVEKHGDRLAEAVLKKLQESDIVVKRNSKQTREVVFHKLAEGGKGITWSLREKN